MKTTLQYFVEDQNKKRGLLWTEDDKEEFGQSILEESMKRLKEEGDLAKIQAFVGNTYKYGYLYQAADILKQHFGVEK